PWARPVPKARREGGNGCLEPLAGTGLSAGDVGEAPMGATALPPARCRAEARLGRLARGSGRQAVPPARKIRVEGRVRCGLVRAPRPCRFRRPFRGNAAIAESYCARRAQCAAWRWHVWIASGGVVEEVPDGSGAWEIE